MDPVRVDRVQHDGGGASKFLFPCQHQVKQLGNYVFIVTCNEVVMSFSTFSRYSWHCVYLAASAVNNNSDCERFWHKRTKPRMLISNESAWFAGVLSVIMSLLLHDLSALEASPAWLLAQQSFGWLVAVYKRRRWCCVWRPTTKSE